ncbi:ketopantoate reductase family protein [Streptosporangium subroseum]|uniref:ketopantoate reductase family protein n=1 Tax=Streptosporangium subroseum TaxID=106412 RepID=UPI00308F8CB3|nr:ketopantoate reductase family protein [Streptosporangium subroseum]
MRILVVGAGAVGGYFGGRLVQAGRDVTFLVRPGRARLLRERGLRIVGLGEKTTLTPRTILTGEITSPFDLVLLSVKATGLRGAMEDLAPAIGPDTLILPVLNGMRHIDDLVERFGDRAVLGGVAKVATTLDADGDIVRLAELQSLTYGARGTAAPKPPAGVHRALSGAGFDAALSGDIIGEMWAKWVFIAATGAVTCLMRGTVGEVVAAPGGTGFAEAVVAECAAVAAAAGHPVPERELENTRDTVTAPGSPFASSLYRDLVHGHRIEGEHIFGDLISRARRLGVTVPLLDLATLHLRVYQGRLEKDSGQALAGSVPSPESHPPDTRESRTA